MRAVPPVLLLLCAACGAQNPPVATSVTFHCLWWSDQQKNGLNPNSPPPKTTEVIIKRWEYTDPIEVPHPDVVDIVVEIRNTSGESLKDVVVEAATSWRVGPVKSEAIARWEIPSPVPAKPAVTIEPGGTHTLRVPVQVAKKMKELRGTEKWPWTLRAQVTVKAGAKTIGTARAELPVTPGD